MRRSLHGEGRSLRRGRLIRITHGMSAQAPQKRLYIKTYGCQMNVYDSERMADVLRPLGYGLIDADGGSYVAMPNEVELLGSSRPS